MARGDWYKWHRIADYTDVSKKVWKISYVRYGAGWYQINLMAFVGNGIEQHNIRMRAFKLYNPKPDSMSDTDIDNVLNAIWSDVHDKA